MKPVSQPNYTIRFFPEGSQHEKEDSAIYEGIYNIQINHLVNVCLCPTYNTLDLGLPPEPDLLNQLIPTDQGISTTDAARAFSITFGQLVLLEYQPQAGQLLCREYTLAELNGSYERQVEIDYSRKHTVHFYCLTHAEYVQYAAEVEAMMNREFDGTNPEEHPRIYNRLDNLRHYGVIARIHHLLTTHPQILSDYERELLCL